MEIYNSRNNVIDEAGHPKLHDLVDDIWNGIIKKEKHRIKHCTDYNIDDEDSSEVLDDDDDDLDSRSNQMKRNLRVTFKSDHPTEFEIGLDYRIPFKVKKGQPKQLDYVHQLLQDYKAYQFLDKNYLGYVFAEICGIEEDRYKLPIHFLKSTDPKINGTENSQDIVFMAIEVTPEVKKAIIKRAFNGATKLANLSEELHTVTIDGKEYQIIGVATVQNDKNTDPALISTFQDFINGINNELNPKIEEARKNGQAFVLSEKYSTIISQINTGRLEKTNDAEDVGDTKVSLYDFMTSTQGKSDRRTSTEWSTGGDFYFGVVLNNLFRIIARNNTEAERISDPNESRLIINHPNDRWMEKNNGALVLLIPKPDGQLYPVRVTRRTVGDFLEKVADGVHTGRELLELADHNPKENEYLSEILQNLRILLDDDKSMRARIKAKMQLSKFFIFGKKTSAISINRDGVTLKFGDEKHTLSGSTIEEQIKDFFDTLAYHRIKFTLPKSFVGTGIIGRDVITSGAFEIGLKNFYNFNANFTVLPINGKGEMVIVKEPEALSEEEIKAVLDSIKKNPSDINVLNNLRYLGKIIYQIYEHEYDQRKFVESTLHDLEQSYKDKGYTLITNPIPSDNEINTTVNRNLDINYYSVYTMVQPRIKKGNEVLQRGLYTRERGLTVDEAIEAIKKGDNEAHKQLEKYYSKQNEYLTEGKNSHLYDKNTSCELMSELEKIKKVLSWRFSGKNLKDLSSVPGASRLITFLSQRPDCVTCQKILPALQFAEKSGFAIDDNFVLTNLQAIIEEPDDNRWEIKLNELISKIKHCS